MPWADTAASSSRCHLGESYLETEQSVYIRRCPFQFVIRCLRMSRLISWDKRKETKTSSWIIPQHGDAIRQVCFSLLRHAVCLSSTCLKPPTSQRLLACIMWQPTFIRQWAWKEEERLCVLCLAAIPSIEVISAQYVPKCFQIRWLTNSNNIRNGFILCSFS